LRALRLDVQVQAHIGTPWPHVGAQTGSLAQRVADRILKQLRTI